MNFRVYHKATATGPFYICHDESLYVWCILPVHEPIPKNYKRPWMGTTYETREDAMDAIHYELDYWDAFIDSFEYDQKDT
jgi:hypothetical protein